MTTDQRPPTTGKFPALFPKGICHWSVVNGRWSFQARLAPIFRPAVYCPVNTVGVAQLVERWIVAPVAEGSIPFAHPLAVTSSVVRPSLVPEVQAVPGKALLGYPLTGFALPQARPARDRVQGRTSRERKCGL
jgi:hypothetical protein